MKNNVKRKLAKYRNMYWKNNLMENEVIHKEKYLNKECNKIWEFTNPKGEKYLFGMFDDIIVTLGYYMTQHRKFFPSY